jgi:adenylosuccinate synthase
MSVKAIVGANWGDEGKGKIIDWLSSKADVVVRFQGGQNAGHTIINEYGKFVMHLLPSGVFYPNIINVLGPGVALDIKALLNELKELKGYGIIPKVYVSDRAQVVLPFHLLFDKYEELRLGSERFGSTQKGIAPFYSDKYMKLGIRVSDLSERNYLLERLEKSLSGKNILLEHYYKQEPLKPKDIADELIDMYNKIKPLVCNTTRMLHSSINENKNILLEGQLGALRDPDHGIYPFTTSSSTLAGFASVGAGIPPYAIDEIIAVTKVYSTCVGAGPFVTEICGDKANDLRERGGDSGEYGATTGRPRRMGWFDAVATKYGCILQSATDIALSMLDVLSYLEEIPLCTGYDIDGKITTEFPVQTELLKAQPVYEYIKGWKCDIRGTGSFDDLPDRAKKYVKRIEELIEIPVRHLSTGPRREEIIEVERG